MAARMIHGIVTGVTDPPTPDQIAALRPQDFKVLENRCRRMAKRQLLQLRRSRRRDPRAHDFGQYTLTNQRGTVVASGDLRAMLVYLVTPR